MMLTARICSNCETAPWQQGDNGRIDGKPIGAVDNGSPRGQMRNYQPESITLMNSDFAAQLLSCAPKPRRAVVKMSVCCQNSCRWDGNGLATGTHGQDKMADYLVWHELAAPV